jgi:hypothetical protein
VRSPRTRFAQGAHAQRPSSAMIPHPANMHTSAYASLPFEASIISLLNRNSCASNYSEMPVSAQSTSLTMEVTHLDETGVD